MPLKRDGLPSSPGQSRSAAAIGRYLRSRTAVTGGKPTSCWISSTATERGDLGAACTAGWHPTLRDRVFASGPLRPHNGTCRSGMLCSGSLSGPLVALDAAAVIACISSCSSWSAAAARLSSRCAGVAVPGMGSMTGEAASATVR